MPRIDAIVLRAFCLWTVWVWGTRLWNIWTDDTRDISFKAVHTVLAAVSLGFALATWRIVARGRRRLDGAEGTGARAMVESAHESA
jgi:hypothetical protein